MAHSTLTGTLNMLTATIDWRDETARCVGVFRSEHASALEVEYTVHLDTALLDLLARAFLKAGVPVLRGSSAEHPGVQLLGETLSQHILGRRPRSRPAKPDGGPRIDRRTRAWKAQQRVPEQVIGSDNGGNGS
jgi:hypothetical protein